MAYASGRGHVRVSARKPQAQAVCMRCGFWYNRVDLTFQFDWRGAQLQNLFILVCDKCLDVPQEQLRAITLPADPTPIYYPSVENFDESRSDYRSRSAPPVIDPETGITIPGTDLRVTEDGQNRTLEPVGVPLGRTQNAVMPWNGAVQKAFRVPLEVLSVRGDGTATVTVTCRKVHNMHTDDQVAVQGLAFGPACGIYSVTVLTATLFTYMTYGSNPADSLLTPTTLIVTALVGLP